ncbi:hypothetical protein [Nocardioides sp. L-11A]|uniref:hypothetical protein n=1 Tax=Nocardioides sp. L-11A TaxID=3043848 RepID=UPI002499CC86|nr:hypothetical protein QJ852_22960 [Nocardioides sp. L-11A]
MGHLQGRVVGRAGPRDGGPSARTGIIGRAAPAYEVGPAGGSERAGEGRVLAEIGDGRTALPGPRLGRPAAGWA